MWYSSEYNHTLYTFLYNILYFISTQIPFNTKDLFQVIPPLCAKTNMLITEVFTNPEMVMSKFVLTIYHSKIQVNCPLQ